VRTSRKAHLLVPMMYAIQHRYLSCSRIPVVKPLEGVYFPMCGRYKHSMEISEQLTCLFAAEVEERDHSYVIEIPKQEVDIGYVNPTEDYQIALLKQPGDNSQSAPPQTGDESSQQPDLNQPPVSTGETRVVEITELGDQGDGLTRVERGFVVIVPETEVGERVRIRIETVHETVAFGEVVERYRY